MVEYLEKIPESKNFISEKQNQILKMALLDRYSIKFF